MKSIVKLLLLLMEAVAALGSKVRREKFKQTVEAIREDPQAEWARRLGRTDESDEPDDDGVQLTSERIREQPVDELSARRARVTAREKRRDRGIDE